MAKRRGRMEYSGGGYSLPCSVDGGSSPLQAHKEMLEREEEDKSCDDIILE